MEEDFLDLGFSDVSNFKRIFGEDAFEEETTPDKEPENNEEKKQQELEEPIKENESEESQKTVETTVEKEQVNNKNIQESGDPSSEQGSPNLNSSIAKALKEDGVLETLDDERIQSINTTEELIEALKEDQYNQLDERQKRIDAALNAQVEPTLIQQYERTIYNLNQITDEILENDENENYRKNLIFQNFLNKGFSEEDANEMTERSINGGSSVRDAKKALSALQDYYNKEYQKVIEDAKQEVENRKEAYKKQAKEIQDSILNDDAFYEQFDIPKTTRKKIYDTVAKPIYDIDGKKVTTLQKYIHDNPKEAYKTIGTLYVLTNGFKDFSNIMKGEVKKEVKKNLSELEKVIKGTSKINDSSLSYRSGVTDNSKFRVMDFNFDD